MLFHHTIDAMKRQAVFLTKNQIETLHKLAEKTGLKISEHIRRAIDSYLEQQAAREGSEHDKAE